VNQENQSAIQEFYMRQPKIYPFGTCTVYQKKSKCYSRVPSREYTQLKLYRAFKICVTPTTWIFRM